MVKRIDYGRTVWGNYFLETLNSFYNRYESARILRGKTYANTGKVCSIDLKDSIIKSKVRGNWDPFYHVSLEFTSFENKEKKMIINIIKNNPIILSELMNANLSDILLNLLKEKKIDIFPKDWKSLKRSCSCPDWGDPCKHMAGVYYILTKKIDANPFLLFELRGLNLIKEFKIAKNLKIDYPFLLKYEKSKNFDINSENLVNSEILEDSSEFILSNIEDNPVFYKKNFKETLEKFYKYSKRFLPMIIFKHQNENIEILERFFKESDFKVEVDKELYNSKVILLNDNLENKIIKKIFKNYSLKIKKNSVEFDIIEFIRFFLSFTSKSKSNILYNYFYELSRFVFRLIESNSFIISVIDKKDYFRVVFTPLMTSINIKRKVDNLNRITPIFLKLKNTSKYLDKMSTNNILVSSIISNYVYNLKFNPKVLSNHDDISVINTIFKQEKFIKESSYTFNFAYAINNYFSIFRILKSEITFSLYIDKINKENYSISLMVDNIHISDLIKTDKVNNILKFLLIFKNNLPEIYSLLSEKSIKLSPKRLSEFILKEKEQFMKLGVEVILPKELKELLIPKLKVKVVSDNMNFQTFLDMKKILNFDYKISLGNYDISINEFEKLVSKGEELIFFKNNFILLKESEIKKIFSLIEKKKTINKYDFIKMNFNNSLDIDEDLKVKIDEIFSYKEYTLPKINTSLRDYQIKGINWGINNLLNGFGIILADDMGLGKTIQAITILKYFKEKKIVKKTALIILPTSLIENWISEIGKFAPSLTYGKFYGKDKVLKNKDIIFTTYHTLIRREQLKNGKFDTVIIDEAQKIKNSSTSISKSVKSIKSKYKIALSGTPVENNLSELWSIFDFSMPKYLGGLSNFRKNFAKPIEKFRDYEKITELKNITAPFMIRRLKTDKKIARELPKKIITNYYINMKKEQLALYSATVKTILKEIKDGSKGGIIFKLITSLKQICNHPRNFDKKSNIKKELSGKTEMLIELLKNIMEKEEKTLIFTQYTEMGDILSKIIEEELFTSPLFLKGSTRNRAEMINKFQLDPKYKIFIISLKAGGTGLNLTAANNVIHYDLWFNPAVENQATDRAFRIGQKKNVNVFRFITKNSFEEKIDKMISSKLELSELTVSIGEKWIGKMTNEELKKVFI